MVNSLSAHFMIDHIYSNIRFSSAGLQKVVAQLVYTIMPFIRPMVMLSTGDGKTRQIVVHNSSDKTGWVCTAHDTAQESATTRNTLPVIVAIIDVESKCALPHSRAALDHSSMQMLLTERQQLKCDPPRYAIIICVNQKLT